MLIDPHWEVIDLDPHTWRNIGRFIEPAQYIRSAQPGEHGLFVLHDGTRILRAVDTQTGLRRDITGDMADPCAFAAELYESGVWQRVHVINKQHLADVARLAQQPSHRSLTLDAYYHLVYNLVWDDPTGYVSMPPRHGHWNGWTYRGITEFVAQLPDAATVALGVIADTTIEIGLIFELHGGMIRRVTTFEALDLPAVSLSDTFLDDVWQQLAARFAPPAAVLLCSPDVFESWISAPTQKFEVLQAAADQNAALWRLHESLSKLTELAGSRT